MTRIYRQRNTTEQRINRIKEWRGLAFRFDKTPASHLAGLHLRGAILWIHGSGPPEAPHSIQALTDCAEKIETKAGGVTPGRPPHP
ncbi:hypothetical protein FHS22_005750 [Planomonospora venezuelensis]|uniref:Transposase n=1 Tax=Planomonospora venezuelensis TaxID=1999 RepID=A0A841DAF6_PLAVE|nr:hypothetical protein [Planomonospora venezuelensis]